MKNRYRDYVIVVIMLWLLFEVLLQKKIGGLSYLLYNLELLCVKNHRYPEIGTIFTKELIVLFFIQRKSVNLR